MATRKHRRSAFEISLDDAILLKTAQFKAREGKRLSRADIKALAIEADRLQNIALDAAGRRI